MVKKGCCVEWACSEAFDPALPVVTFPSPAAAASSRKMRPFGFASKPSSASTSNHKVRRHRERAAASQGTNPRRRRRPTRCLIFFRDRLAKLELSSTARDLVSVSAFHASAALVHKSRCQVEETEWSPCSKQ